MFVLSCIQNGQRKTREVKSERRAKQIFRLMLGNPTMSCQGLMDMRSAKIQDEYRILGENWKAHNA